MGSPVVRDQQAGFGGGLNTAADESMLDDSECRRLENALLNEYGAAIKRRGSRRLNATALGNTGGTDIQGGCNFRLAAGDQNVVVAYGKLYTFPYAVPATVTTQVATMETSGAVSMAQFLDGSSNEALYIADGGTGLNKWGGAAFSADLAGTPTGITQLAVYNQRLFGITGEDQTLWVSPLNNGDKLGVVADGGIEAVIRTFGDQRLTGLAAVQDSLLIWHVSGISRFTGWTQDDVNIAAGAHGVTSDVGTIAPRTIVPLEGEALFLTERGFYSASGEGVTPISAKIEDAVAGLSTAALAASFGVHFRTRREVWFYLSGLGVYVFNYRTRAWAGPLNAGYLDPVSTCAWEGLNTTGVPVVLFGDSGGFVKQAEYPETYLDNTLSDATGGTVFEAVIQMRRMFSVSGLGREFEASKAWRWGYLLMDPNGSDDVTVEWTTAYGADSYAVPLASSTWGSGTWGLGVWGGAGVLSFRIPLSGRGHFVDFTIRDNGEASALYSRYSIDAFRLSRRG